MSGQLVLLRDAAAPAQRHSATSRAAARLIESKRDTLLKRVYVTLRALLPDGATDEEAQDGLGMTGNTYRPRRIELGHNGLVVDSGRTRKTRAGREAVVWNAVHLEGD